MIDFLATPGVDIVSPLDHPDSYDVDRRFARMGEIRHSRHCHWRTVASTCCTFMLKSQTFAKARKSLSLEARGGGVDFLMGELLTKKDVFSLNSVLVQGVKYMLTKRNWRSAIPLLAWRKLGLRLIFAPRFTLWTPIPTLGVHLCTETLSLGYEQILGETGER